MGVIISALFAALARAPADRPALEDGSQSLTYAQLTEAVAAEWAWLASTGVQRFGLLADNGLPWVVSDLGLHVLGRLAVPLPGYFTAAQRRHALDDAGVDGLLTDARDGLLGLSSDWQLAGRSPGTGLWLYRRTIAAVSRPAVPERTVKVTYTSGSTGSPKGVCLSASHLEAVARSLADATAPLGVRRHLCILPLATLLENVAGVYAPLLAGATCVLPPSAVTGMSYAGPDLRKLLTAIATSATESLILVPELLQALVIAAERGWPAPRSLKFIAVGGASVSASLLDRASAAGLPVYEGYGLSECASVVCLNTPEARRRGSVGQVLPHARLNLSADGEIVVSGSTMLGYLGGEQRRPGQPWMTGDLGEVDADGYVYVRGRRRNLFITSYGRNVAPEWVEREIAQRLPQRPVLVHGEARPYAVALVSGVAEDREAAEIERVVAAANAELPDYARVRRWARIAEPFTFENGLLTSNGRLRRAAIVERHGALLDALYREEIAS